MERGVRTGDYSVKAKQGDIIVSRDVVSGGGNIAKAGTMPDIKAENTAKIFESKKEKKRPRLILSDSESDEGLETYHNANYYVDRKPSIKIVTDVGTDQDINGSVDRKLIRIETVKRSQDVGVGRNIVKSGDFKHNEEIGIDRREIKVEHSFRKREEGVIDRKRFKVEEGGIDRKMIKVEEGGIDRRRIKVGHFKYHERSVAGRKEINAKAGPCKQMEDTELGSSKMRVDRFNRREEIESDQKKLKVDPFKEAEINRKRINAVDPFKYREDAVKKIKVDPTKCREETDIDRKMIKVVPVRGKEESEAKGTFVKDVKLITYVRQREGKNGSSSHNLTDIRSQQPIMGRKNNTNTVLGRQKGQDHPDDEGFRMQKAEHPHLDGVAREKLRLSLNHSIRLQGKGGVLKLTPSHKKPAVGLPEVSHNHRKPEGMARNDRSEANSPMQKKVFHQPPLGFDPHKSDSYSTVPKKNQQGRSLYFLTDKIPDQKRKGTNISMRNISSNIEKVSRGKTSSQPESSAVHIDLVPSSSKKMKIKLGDMEPFPGKNMETTRVDRVHLSRKIMATKHADVAPSSSKQMGTERFDVVPSSAKMLETKHTDVEPLSSKNTETKHVDTVPLSGKKTETKMGEAHRLRQQRLLLRQRLRKLILNAGWKIEMRPRRGRNYQDSVYVSPDGVGYWSIVNAYNALLRESNCKDEEKGHLGLAKPGGQEMDIPIEDLSILTRKTKAKELRKIKGGKMAKKIKEQAGGAQSVKVRDGSQRKNLKGATKQHLIKKKHARANMKINSDFAKEGKALKGRIKENGVLGLNSKGINRNLSGNYHHKKSSHLSRGCALVVRGSSKGNPNPDDHSIPYSGKRNILSWLIDSGVVPENGKVHYMNKKFTRVMMEGWITRDGIHCGCCSKIVTVSKFEIHAGSKLRQPYQNVLLETGISLMQCQIKAWNAQDESKRIGFHVVDLNGSDKNDDTCGICGDGGDLICCDSCPSTFHLYCLDLQALPPGDWHCPYCSCRFCGVVEGTNLGEEATISPMLSCVQCEEKYHCDCTGKMDAMTASTVVPHATFCGKDCQKLFKRLQDLLGLKNDLDGGFSWTLIRRFDEDSEMSRRGLAQRAECNSKIAVALTVMDECFMPIIDQRSRVNTIHNVVYNSGSNFNRLNYGGFYTVLLERGDDIISAASIRIHGTRLAEMPLIGTRHIYRRQGMCRRLFNAIESVLGSLKVEKLVIPAISDLMQTWIEVFGFKPLEEWHKHEIRSMNMVVFPGTDMLQKQLKKSDFTGSKYTQPGEGENHVVNELKCSQHNTSKMANQSVVASAPGSYVHECSEVNLCDGFGVIGPKEAPNVGSDHPSGEHIVDSNGSEALSSIPCEDLEIMCTADVNELKSSQHDTSEVENKSLPSSAEPNPLECVEDALHNTFVLEVEGAAMEPNLPSFGEGDIHHTSDVNTNALEVSSSSKSQPSTRETKYGIFESVNKSSEISTEALEVNFGHNDQSSAMDTVPFTSDLIDETPEAALDMGCRLASDVVNACGVSEVIGSKYAAHLKSNCAAGEYIVKGDGIVRLLAIPCGATDIMCTDTANGLKYIQHDTTELATVSLAASLVEASPHPSGMVIVHDAHEENVEDAAVGSDLPAFGENFVGHNSEICTKSVEVAWRSNFQSSSEDTVCYTAESLEGCFKV